MNHKNTNFDFYRLNVKMKRLVKGKLYYQLYDYLKFNDNYDIDIEELGENEVQFSSSSIKIFDNLENALCKFSKEYPNQIIIFEIIENKNGISGYYLVKLVNSYIKNDDIVVDMYLIEKKERWDKIANVIKFYNCDKYKKTNTYKYIIKNAGKLLHTALTTVKNVIKDNSFMVDIIKQKVLNSKSDVEKIYFLNYLNNECGGQGKCAFNNLTDFEPAYYGWNPVFQDGRMELHIPTFIQFKTY